MYYTSDYEICKGCKEDYHPTALINGYCVDCSEEEFSDDEFTPITEYIDDDIDY